MPLKLINKVMRPYTYFIGWTKQNKYYYGVQYGITCDPDNLWKTYFTSSDLVKDFRNTYGEPDLVEVRRIFDNVDDAKAWELKVLQRLKVVLREDFLNKNAAPGPPPKIVGSTIPVETREKISAALKGKKKTEEHRKKLSEANKGKTSKKKGKTYEEIHGSSATEIKLKLSEAGKKQKQSHEEKTKRIESRKNGAGWSAHSEETKKKISNSFRGKRMYTNGEVNKFFLPGEEPTGFVKKGK